MIERSPLVRKFLTRRFCATAMWFLVSGYLVQSAQAGYGQVPLFFVENRGQLAADEVRYIVKGPALTGYFSPHQLALTMGASSFHVSFPGANPAVIEGTHLLAAQINYMVGARGQWKVNVPAYGAVAYRGIFPGIDLIYSASSGRLKSDFILAPGADPSAIRLLYDGGTARLEPDGALVLANAAGEFRENAPEIYQEISGRRTTVQGSFLMRENGTIGFHVGAYDRTRPLVIDPVLSYSTYLGGGGMDAITSIAVDGGGNTYVAGWTTSIDLPTVNPAHAQNGGGVDAFVAKLGPGGNTLIYCTYLGGRGDDRAFAIAADAAGNAYVTGWTASSAFPTVAPAQSTLAGGKDAFVAKLSPAGNTLIYSTYLGGAANDGGNAIAVDAAGNAYVAGGTYSLNFPTLGAYQSSNRRAAERLHCQVQRIRKPRAQHVSGRQRE